MAIRLKKEIWSCIRREYEAGATAPELAARFKGVKSASIHARAGREKWNEVELPSCRHSALNAVVRSKAEGISMEAATELEAIDQQRAFATHRGEITRLGAVIVNVLDLAAQASKNNDTEMAKFASILISTVNEASNALRSKMDLLRFAFGNPPVFKFETQTHEIVEPDRGNS